MDFSYSEEQRMLADSLRRFIETGYTFEKRRAIVCGDAGMDPAIWAGLAELGIQGLNVRAEHGGFGADAATQLVVQHELGRGLVSEPITPSAVIATTIIQGHGNDEQRRAWLPGLAAGACIAATAYLEQGGRSNPEAVQTVAERAGEAYVLNGAKTLVWHGAAADVLVVSARLAGTDGLSLFLVPTRGTAGLALASQPTMDGQRAASVRLADVRLPASALLGAPGAGLAALQAGLDWGIAALCAEAAGAMERLIELTAEYLRTRKQFGVPLASFQALQHRMADMLVQKELALSMAYVAAQALDEADAAARQRKLSAAKVVVARAGRYVGEQAIQLHGGMGMTDEMAPGDYFKRLAMIDPLLGGTDHHLDRYAALLQA
ncbi:acyl-CoA dehydrogenase [Bordetella pertussis]|uniref:Acyl-CoA dehydrogenase fadE12 n=34 Tax=Bordetella pertussis TaxID=520 RepID=A0A381A8B1_BORPT|nr:acyl-CoA dehydrogenase [Bordetella pertussis]ETH38489.1 acyl-CoA dehydrogenase, C-terminal domain protein [Bordetella pertussis H918]ETH43707.1 acyl-CoA dehydrogenase, C-terminal domain protein [Bordetella pertussis H939]ETH45966.1 acyl-CoA dehydrogenase, C-terminal domain protein [Bordetella pertussis H921]ETH72626.1 acyl-CoA dehydrogenase, C-terminal domain protein [Bordetella pertussis STO1-CHLA-0011]ETH90437.1 acyl-CoA dehydrogenase, C-terminal domain protein [Bordetella pertussis STO1-